jgi:hypothetical protein
MTNFASRPVSLSYPESARQMRQLPSWERVSQPFLRNKAAHRRDAENAE